MKKTLERTREVQPPMLALRQGIAKRAAALALVGVELFDIGKVVQAAEYGFEHASTSPAAVCQIDGNPLSIVECPVRISAETIGAEIKMIFG